MFLARALRSDVPSFGNLRRLAEQLGYTRSIHNNQPSHLGTESPVRAMTAWLCARAKS